MKEVEETAEKSLLGDMQVVEEKRVALNDCIKEGEELKAKLESMHDEKQRLFVTLKKVLRKEEAQKNDAISSLSHLALPFASTYTSTSTLAAVSEEKKPYSTTPKLNHEPMNDTVVTSYGSHRGGGGYRGDRR